MDEDSKALVKAAAEVVLQPVASVVSNTIGVLGGDRLDAYRKANRDKWAKYYADERAKISQETDTPDLRMAAQILEEVQDESRDELLKIWAKLMAALVDSSRAPKCRREFVEIAKQLEPLDAQVLPIFARSEGLEPTRIDFAAAQLHSTQDQVRLAARNLFRLELTQDNGNLNYSPHLLPLGRQFLEIVRS